MTSINPQERQYLRELAKKQLHFANLPVMELRRRRWYKHNHLEECAPMVVMEENTFLPEILPESRVQSEAARIIEKQLLQNITAYELICDDKVMPDYFTVNLKLDKKLFGLDFVPHYAENSIGYHIEPQIEDLERDFYKLGPSVFSYDREYTHGLCSAALDVLGDILPVRLKNRDHCWEYGITQKAVNMMGMERMFCEMMDNPDLFHRFMQYITDEFKGFLRWQEREGLLFENNGNDYLGSGSYCFNNILESDGGLVKSTDTWGHLNSQESVGISPDMYHEFIYPYYAQMAKEFGLLYYGCCEPVHPFWDRSVSKYANLRKVSISAWCDERFMGERLEGSGIIYSRKPSPNFIGVQKEFDEQAFSAHIKQTLDAAKGCKKEFIFRDIYQLHGNLVKLRKAVDIVRKLCG